VTGNPPQLLLPVGEFIAARLIAAVRKLSYLKRLLPIGEFNALHFVGAVLQRAFPEQLGAIW
jgi:hypothetical protein